MIHRYGSDVVGGAELMCRRIAERLSRRMAVTVVTTCAKDYVTWRDHYRPGEAVEDGVRVLRFPVDVERGPRRFDLCSRLVFKLPHPAAAERLWMRMQGPLSSPLLAHLRESGAEYDLLVFFTYLYATTYFGLREARGRTVLFPTAHDEPPLRLDLFDEVFRRPDGIVFLTEEERELCVRRFGLQGSAQQQEVIGPGIDPPPAADPAEFRQRYGVHGRYVVYVGRIDVSKGVGELVEMFRRYQEARGQDLKLVLVGSRVMKLEPRPDMLETGYLDERMKASCISGAELLVMPSPYESFSFALLEAWALGVPALVNGACAVLAGHCARSGGGLVYRDGEGFSRALESLLGDRTKRDAMGASGRRYVEQSYLWQSAEERYLDFFRRVRQAPDASTVGRQRCT